MEDTSTQEKQFAVFKFSNDTIEAVPKSWVTDDKCPWPNIKIGLPRGIKIPDSVPDSKWPLYSGEIIKTYSKSSKTIFYLFLL